MRVSVSHLVHLPVSLLLSLSVNLYMGLPMRMSVILLASLLVSLSRCHELFVNMFVLQDTAASITIGGFQILSCLEIDLFLILFLFSSR